MKKPWHGVLGAFLAFPVLAEPAALSPLSQHVTLVVRDIDRSIAFYEALGLVKSFDITTRDTDAGGVVGAEEIPVPAKPKIGRVVFMSGKDGESGKIGLLGYDSPRLSKTRSKLKGIMAGEAIVDLDVPDIQIVYANLSRIKAYVQHPPTDFSFIGAGGRKQTV